MNKKILLISNKVFHYRISVYNAFFDLFKERGYEFHVLSNEYQGVDFDIKFIKHKKPFGVVSYVREINKINPDVVINFLHLKDKLIIPLTYYCKFKHIPMIYWNHGINIKTPDAKIKNLIFHFIHTISSAIILYTPDQLKYLSDKNKQKTFIAYNTLDFSQVDTIKIRNKDEVKKLYGITENKVVIYISRILPYKGLDVLLDILKESHQVGLVIVGSGINSQQMNIIDTNPNYYYLGEKYGKEVDEIYNMGDIFSTPGHIGLALCQSMFWGKPVVVLNTIHAPEIYYLKPGYNGYVVDSKEELKEKILLLCENDELLNSMSENARNTFEDTSIDRMFQGFIDAIEYVQK